MHEEMKWQAVFDEHTLDVCSRAHGSSAHPPVKPELQSMCRCVRVSENVDRVDD